MNDEIKVWLTAYKLRRSNKRQYRARWFDPATRKYKSKTLGTDQRCARDQIGVLKDQLNQGTYRSSKRIGWADFVDDHVGKIKGAANAKEARRTLVEFGELTGVPSPRKVTYSLLEEYVSRLRGLKNPNGESKNSPATINKKLRYVRSALNKAIRRGFAATSDMDGGLFEEEDEKLIREVSDAEENALLDAGEARYGVRWRSLIHVALNTGGRRGELLSLSWGNVKLDGDKPHVFFVKTKSKKNR